jgi:multiple sugar transport system ATP-binding protein
MRAELARLHERLGTTTVYVTHDQVEAMTLGQRVAVMRDGKVLQFDEPQRLYREPENVFVAAFIGSPAMNLVDATIDGDEIAFGQFRVPLPPDRRPKTGHVVLGIRPEAFEDATLAPRDKPTLATSPTVVEELGSDVHVLFPLQKGTNGALLVEEETLLTARVDPRTRVAVGASFALAVDPDRFHFFDPDTGERVAAQ